MIDLFGLRHKDSPDPVDSFDTAAQDTPAQIPAPTGSHRLWAMLLVLDSIFVIVFSGAVAAKVYHYLETPLAAVPFTHRHQTVKSAAPTVAAAPIASTVTVAAKPPEPEAKPPESLPAAKPESAKASSRPDTIKTAAGAATPRPPKPSMLTESPKPHSPPSLASAGSAPSSPFPIAAAAGAKQKAAPVVFKITAPNARKVFLVGAFIVHGGRKEMTRDDGDVWSVRIYLNPGQYRYFFAVDKKKTLDPENPQTDHGASLMSVP